MNVNQRQTYQPSGDKPSIWQGMFYGLLGLPLAFVALPIYVYLPNLYASEYGMSLATLGAVLLIARLFDAVSDPWLGRVSDRIYSGSVRKVFVVSNISATVLVLGMVLLLFPPWTHPDNSFALLTSLMITGLAFSMLTITHQAWGAQLGGNETQRARIVAWREAAGLIGVILATVLPNWLGWDKWIAVFALTLALGCLTWSRSITPPQATPAQSKSLFEDLLHPWRKPLFRRLIAVFVLSGMASAIPATLVLFFIQDLLKAPGYEPIYLSTYFISAAISIPLWIKVVGRWGLQRSWLMGMILSVTIFFWAGNLTSGDLLGFWCVCLFSGLALGSELTFPGALLAGIIAKCGDRGQRDGAYFGWWNMASKLNLALSAGLSLPLLQWLGYTPGSSSQKGLEALTLVYAVLPCTLKVLAAIALYLAFVRPPSPVLSTIEEV